MKHAYEKEEVLASRQRAANADPTLTSTFNVQHPHFAVVLPDDPMASSSQKQSRFGDLDARQPTSNPTGEAPGHWQTLHVPLYDNPEFAFSSINPSDYDFYLLPLSRAKLSALMTATQATQLPLEAGPSGSEDGPCTPVNSNSSEPKGRSTTREDVEEMYWNVESQRERSMQFEPVPASSSSSGGMRLSPSGHELLLQNLVEEAAKFVPSRFSGPPPVQMDVKEGSSSLMEDSEHSGNSVRVHNVCPLSHDTDFATRVQEVSVDSDSSVRLISFTLNASC